MSSRMSATVTLRVEMTVEAGPWGDDCSLGQLRKQALDAARVAVLNLLGEVKRSDVKIRVLSTADVQIHLEEPPR